MAVRYGLLVDPTDQTPVMGFITDGTMGTYVTSDGQDDPDMNYRLPDAIAHWEIEPPTDADGWITLALSNMILAMQDSADADTVEEARAAIAARFQALPSTQPTDEGPTP